MFYEIVWYNLCKQLLEIIISVFQLIFHKLFLSNTLLVKNLPF